MMLRISARCSVMVPVVAFAVALGVASTVSSAPQPTRPGPTVVSQAAFPVAVKAGDYDLLNLILAFAPGAGVPEHYHGGSVLVTVLSGEITLLEKGTARIVRAGQSWSEKPRAVHAVVNRGKVSVRVAVSILLPKGAEATTLVHP